MKPTISNAFNDGSSDITGSTRPQESAWGTRLPKDDAAAPAPEQVKGKRGSKRNPRQSLAASLAAMQVDLRETDFGWSLDLSPMLAIDALQGLKLSAPDGSSLLYLVSMEQSTWRDGEAEMPISEIVERLAITVAQCISSDQLVMDEASLHQLVSLCQPSRLVAVAVEGTIDERDAKAMTKAIDAGQSPLVAELRAIAAIEVLGDRAVVLHSREKQVALTLVADNFRHYLAALSHTVASKFDAPEYWQIERLLSLTGMLTVRPIETQRFSTSIDVGINTNKERFTQPADRSLIYDVPSNTWHDEP